MSGEDTGPGRREVAHRLFAAEFDDSTVSYAESDEERAPKYVVTPTGARVNRLFAVGVLTEVESVNDDVLRARIVDPTGAFVSYAGQYQPDAAAFFERASPPAFVALAGKARTFEPEDSDRIYTSVRPEGVAEVDAETRDRWTVSAAEATLRRIAAMADARSMDATGETLRAALDARGYDASLAAGIPIALDRYGTTTAYLDALREVALDALEVVTGDRDAVRSLDLAPSDAGTSSLGPLPDAVTVTADAADGADVSRTSEADPAAQTVDEGSTGEDSNADEPSAAGDATAAESDSPTADPATETDDPATETDDPATETDAAVTETDDPATETDAADADPSADEPSEVAAGESDDDDSAAGGLGDFEDDDLYELDEDERREVEESFDVGFESGAEVDDPGQADIDVPGPEDVADPAATDDVGGDGSADAGAVDVGADANADANGDVEADTGSAADEDSDTDVDLETVAVDAMAELDDGDGAARDAVVAAVVEEYGADPGAVADAIEDALMSGKCYEPSEDSLKAI
jgi:RPA family protein